MALKFHVTIDAPHLLAVYRMDVEAPDSEQAISVAAKAAAEHHAGVVVNGTHTTEATPDSIRPYAEAWLIPGGAYVQLPGVSSA